MLYKVSTSTFSESTFEAYGFRGVPLVINILTSTGNCANANIQSAVAKNNAKIEEKRLVLFTYNHMWKLEVPSMLDKEQILDTVIEA